MGENKKADIIEKLRQTKLLETVISIPSYTGSTAPSIFEISGINLNDFVVKQPGKKLKVQIFEFNEDTETI